MANALRSNDEMGRFEFRWERLGPDYNNLPDRVRSPILAGIRSLYEAGDIFSYHMGDKAWHPVRDPESMIRLVTLPTDGPES